MSRKVAIVMGSDSDLPHLEPAIETLKRFDVPCEVRVLSAHRTPDQAGEFARTAAERGFGVIIAAAGGAAHLAGAMAAHSLLPIIGVPIAATPLNGMDALLATVQMPPGIPVATVAIGKMGAANAALLAVQILAGADPALATRLVEDRARMREKVAEKDAAVRARYPVN